MRKYFVILFLLIMLGLSATILNVPQSYHYISLAIMAAADGDTVLVQPGTYNGVISFEGKAITITSNYLFSSNVADIYHTILGGNYSDASLITFATGEGEGSVLSGFTITNNGTTAQGGAVFCDGTSPTLSHLRFIGNSAASGGAIFTNEAAPVIEYCEFEDNSATEFGGAIYLEASEMSLDSSLFQGNVCDGGGTVGRGGAIFVSYSTVALNNSNFYENEANVHAGGVYMSYASADIFQCQFVGNVGGGNVGAVYSYKSEHLEVINCLFYNNTGTNAGALRFYTDVAPIDVPIVLNSICYGNTPCEIFFADDNLSHDLIIAYSDLGGGEDAIVTNDVANIVWLDGNIDSDPLYVAPEYNYYYLQEESACLDAGILYFEYEGVLYIDGGEYYGEARDQGALETRPEDLAPMPMFSADVITGEAPLTVNFTDNSLGNIIAWYWDFDSDGIVDSEEQNPEWVYETAGIYSVELSVFAIYMESKVEVDMIEVTESSATDEELPPASSILNVFPNPFNPSTSINFSLAETEDVTLQAYNLKGELKEVILSETLSSGVHNINWQPENLASGLYFIRLTSGNQSATSKAILLK